MDVLTEVLGSLPRGGRGVLAGMGLDEEGRHPYNEGSLVLLPKKSAGADPRGIPYFESEGTRPLNIVNAGIGSMPPSPGRQLHKASGDSSPADP